MGRMILWFFFPSKLDIERRAKKLKDEISTLVDKYSMKGVKDPRFCATLKFWKPMIKVESFVICLREPAETVHSIKRRQKFPLWLGYRFWNFNMAALLEELSLERTLLIDYNRLLSNDYFDELSLIRRFFKLSLSDEEMTQQYKKVFDPDLYKCKVQEANLLPPETQKLWDKFMELRQQVRKRIEASS